MGGHDKAVHYCILVRQHATYKATQRISADVEQAFTAADMQPSEKIAVRMAEGMREYNEHGEELYGILRKNIYGSPLASRNWSICRNDYLLNEMGREEGWKVTKMLYEPCMFIVEIDLFTELRRRALPDK